MARKKDISIRLRKRQKKLFGEFREFALRGNVIDLAVGVIIGGAFQSIVNSLVKDIIMPLIGAAFGNVDYTNWFLILGNAPEGETAGNLKNLAYVRDTLCLPVFAYGSFITVIINFTIMAFIIFLLVKTINTLQRIGTKTASQEPETLQKQCPFCIKEIAAEATRCPHCTSVLDKENPAV